MQASPSLNMGTRLLADCDRIWHPRLILTYLRGVFTMIIRLEWDDLKNELNVRRRGLAFSDALPMFNELIMVSLDNRRDYGEERFVGINYVQTRLMVVVFCRRGLDGIRIISLRRANNREKEIYNAYRSEVENRLGSS